MRELFVDILGYTLNPQPNFNLTTELKNEKGAKKADGAILTRGHDPLSDSNTNKGINPLALAVIELKGTDTKDLDKINVQAFNYKNNQTGCVYVITSNFEKLRFFIHHSVEHLEFNLFTLTETEFQLLWLCLYADNLLSGVPLKVKEESLIKEEQITKQLYKDYASFRNDLWQNMVKNSSAKDKLLLFKKTQKLLDRYLFIFFAEDSGLLPPNSISRIVNRFEILKREDAYKPLYEIFQQYFGYINKGRKGQKTVDDIFAYNGGLFLPDEILDNIVLDDDILHTHVMKLTNYDFQSDVDVNILGHIFENSLNEIENITAQLEGQEIDKSKSKRKKDGVFYTPKYITKYIVDNTVGKLCDEKKAELGIVDEEYAKGRQNRKKDTVKMLDENLQTYRNWLLHINICDPACGSGAFLNQALEFLMEEHAYVDELQAQLFGSSIVFQDVSNHILEKNIFGVDINEESVDIAKLSLWLRTAQRGRKLTTLNNNIKCGNSLIDDPKVAGDKAFNWQKQFPQIFKEKEKKAFHITWVTHNSRTSQRMIDHKVKKGDAFWLEDEQEVVVAATIKDSVEKDNLNVMAFNSCGDHVHLLLVCEEEEIPNIIRKFKGKSSQKLKEHLQIPKEEQFTLWAQKYSTTYIESEEQLWNTIEYIRNNRLKHNLHNYTDNKGLQPLVTITESDIMQQSYNHAFRTEYKGGFDVVIGNPPYVQINELQDYYLKNYKTAKCGDLYALFYEKSSVILKKNAHFSFITPSLFIKGLRYESLREYLLENFEIFEILDKGDGVFQDVQMPTAIFVGKKKKIKGQIWSNYVSGSEITSKIEYTSKMLSQFSDIKRGLEIGKDKVFNYSIDLVKILTGEDVERYSIKHYKGISSETFEEYKKDQKYFEGKRILIRETGSRITSLIVNENVQQNRSLYSVLLENEKMYEYILGIINSNLMQFYYKSKFAANTDVFPKIRIAQVKDLPIKIAKKEEQILLSEKVNQLIEGTSSFQQTSKLFIQLLLSKFTIEKLTKKLENWHELEFGEFLKELEKARKLSNKESQFHSNKGLQPLVTAKQQPLAATKQQPLVAMKLSEQAEWMQYFNEQKQKAQVLKSEINRVDTEIDKMVYELYGLSEEEIKIVEAS